MKLSLTTVIISVLIFACDPSYTSSYKILNLTTQDIELIMFGNPIDSVSINASNKATIAAFTGLSGGPAELSLYDKDSIIVYSSGGVMLKKYLPSSKGKNIYDLKYWREHKKGKRNYEYTFEITEEDLSQEGD